MTVEARERVFSNEGNSRKREEEKMNLNKGIIYKRIQSLIVFTCDVL